jgi:hypothetical protein
VLSLKDFKKGKYYKYEVRYEGYHAITVFRHENVFIDSEDECTAYILCNNVAHIFNKRIAFNYLDFSIKDYILKLNSFNEKMKLISLLSKRDYYNIVRLFNRRNSNGVH